MWRYKLNNFKLDLPYVAVTHDGEKINMVPFMIILTGIFTFAKLAGSSISWLTVLAPVWIPTVLVFGFFLVTTLLCGGTVSYRLPFSKDRKELKF